MLRECMRKTKKNKDRKCKMGEMIHKKRQAKTQLCKNRKWKFFLIWIICFFLLFTSYSENF